MRSKRARFIRLTVAHCLALILLATIQPRSFAATKPPPTCLDFTTQAAAQKAFLKAGGPAADPNGLDPNGDGVACEPNPAPFMGLLTIDARDGQVFGDLHAVGGCFAGRTVKVSKVGVLTTDEKGHYAGTSSLTKAKFSAQTVKTTSCAAEKSPKVSIPGGRLEVSPAGFLFTGIGQARPLSVSAFDAAGNAVASPPVFWQSSKPSVVSVDRSGVVSAVALGSSQISATVPGFTSSPVLVTVTPLADGAVELSDADIIGDPVETDPNAEPSVDNTFFIVLHGVTPPAVDDLLVDTETKPIVGRVVAVEDLGNGDTKVTLKQVGLDEVFPDLEIDETMDLAAAPADINPDLLGSYDVTRQGSTFTFTPKPEQTSSQARSQRASASGTSALPPFSECEESTTGLRDAVKLAAPPLFSVTVKPSVEFVSTFANGLERFVINANPTITFEGGIKLKAAFEGKFGCKVELFVFRAPIAGPLSAIVSGLIPVGVGFELGGKMQIADAGVGAKAEVKGPAQVGIVCPPGASCSFLRSMDLTPSLTPTTDLPSIGDVRFEPEFTAFGFIKADIGNPFLTRIRLDAFEAKAGAKLAGSFASKTSQIAATDYKSNYGVSLEASAGLGTDLTGIAKLLGIGSVSGLELKISTDLAQSPAGTLLADKPTFVTGDTVNFTGHFDTTKFFGIYNIDRAILVRNSGGQLTEVSTISGRDKDTFHFVFSAPDSGTSDEFFLFVVTNLLPFDVLALEIANATTSEEGEVVSAGGNHTCARLADGSVKCWGSNLVGGLGNGSTTDSSTPVSVSGISTATSVSAGGNHTCARLADGSVKCWGNNGRGELGNGSTTPCRSDLPNNPCSSTPVSVSGISTATSVSAGGNHTCARLADGSVKCWGDNTVGELGNGSTTNSSTPVSVSGISTATSVSAGDQHTCARLADGSVKCWGINTAGELGDGSTTPCRSDFPTLPCSSTPVSVSGISTATSVSAAFFHTCARLADGTVKCWGNNGAGELGNGSTTDSSTPVSVSGISTATSVSAGGQHTCGRLADGSVKCWGINNAGELGDGSTTPCRSDFPNLPCSSTPVSVSGISTATSVSAGSQHTCGRLADGSVKCWGHNSAGELGNGSTTNSSTPVSVSGIP